MSEVLVASLALTAALAACVAGGNREQLESLEQGLVGGAPTPRRPEIGSYYNGVDGLCTATLIAPKYVLTAAHCLNPAYASAIPPATASFNFEDIGGACRIYGVDRVFTFAGKRWEYLPDGVSTMSGVRRGLEVNTDRPGGDYQSFRATTHSPYECQAACADDASCQAWTFVPAGAGANAACSLKREVPTAVPSTGTVSGIRGMEFLP